MFRLIGILTGYGFLGLSILIVIEILMRKLLNTSIQGVDEIGGYVVAIGGAFGMALATVERAHTRIDVLLVRLPGIVQAALNLVAYLCLAAAAAFMTYMAGITLADSLAFGSVTSTPLQTPLWIPQSLWLGGLVLFGLSALWMAAKGLMATLGGKKHFVSVLAPTTIDEAIRESKR